VRVVRLIVPFEEIAERLSSDVTTGRKADLLEAAVQIEGAHGVGLEDLAVVNDRPVQTVAMQILQWLDWGS
jgi:hypothetical protein